MKYLIAIIFLFVFLRVLCAAGTGVAINGGRVDIKAGYVMVGPYISTATASGVASTAGQCIGILCGVTYAN